MAFARKIAYNVVFSSASKVLSTILALISIGFITRYLGRDGFGDYATVLAFLSFFSAILDLGLNAISTREISRHGASEEKIMGNILALRTLSSLLVILIVPLVLWFFPYSWEVKKGIIIIAAAFFFSSTYQVLNGVFQKNLAMDKVAFSELFGKVVQVIVVIGVVKLNWGFDWIIASLLFNMAVSFVLIRFWLRKFLKLKYQFDWSYWKEFLRESWPMGISVLITFLYFKMDTILLSIMKSNSEVGIYNAAYKVIENITFFPSMIMGLILPIMSYSIFRDKERFRDISNKTFKVFLLLVVPLVVAIMFLSSDIIRLIGGAGFSESSGVLQVLVWALAFIFFGNFFNSILISANLQKRLMFILGIAAVFNIVANLILIPQFSYLGAAWVSAGTEMLVVILTGWTVFRKLGFLPAFEKFFQILLSGLAMGIFLFIFRDLSFLILAPGSALVYFLLLWGLGVLTTGELKSLISKKGVVEYENIS